MADVIEADKLSVLRKAICEAAPDLDEDDVEERMGRLRAISKYVYYLEILTDLSYPEVADIFVRVNSKGRALKTVDLTLAVLSAKWPGIVARIDEETSHAAETGWPKIDADFLVRALAATATDAASLRRLPETAVADLEDGWARIKHGLRFLIHLLEENAGIRTSNLIPSINALVPLVVLLGSYASSASFGEADAIIYWLLSVFVTSRYSSAADTKIAQDALAARSEDPIRRLYENAGLIGAPVTVSEQQLLGKGVGSPYFLLSYLAAKRRHAKDWWHDVEISESGGSGGFCDRVPPHPPAGDAKGAAMARARSTTSPTSRSSAPLPTGRSGTGLQRVLPGTARSAGRAQPPPGAARVRAARRDHVPNVLDRTPGPAGRCHVAAS